MLTWQLLPLNYNQGFHWVSNRYAICTCCVFLYYDKQICLIPYWVMFDKREIACLDLLGKRWRWAKQKFTFVQNIFPNSTLIWFHYDLIGNLDLILGKSIVSISKNLNKKKIKQNITPVVDGKINRNWSILLFVNYVEEKKKLIKNQSSLFFKQIFVMNLNWISSKSQTDRQTGKWAGKHGYFYVINQNICIK